MSQKRQKTPRQGLLGRLPEDLVGEVLGYLQDTDMLAMIWTGLGDRKRPMDHVDNECYHLSSVPRINDRWGYWPKDVCRLLARYGYLEVLQRARGNGCSWDSMTCSEAAAAGHLEVLQWARAKGCPWDTWTCYNADIGGHPEVLQWARANGCPQPIWI